MRIGCAIPWKPAMTNTNPTHILLAQSPVRSATIYLQNIQTLTQKNDQTKESVKPQQDFFTLPKSFTPYISALPFILVMLLFVIALGLQINKKIKDIRHNLTSLVLALFAASIPFILVTLHNGLGVETHANPMTVPTTIRILQTSPSSVAISWSTQIPTIGAVRYTINPNDMQTAIVIVETNRTKQTSHTITLSRLSAKTQYYVEILSNALWYDFHGYPIQFQF
jgi:hypothetical protein